MSAGSTLETLRLRSGWTVECFDEKYPVIHVSSAPSAEARRDRLTVRPFGLGKFEISVTRLDRVTGDRFGHYTWVKGSLVRDVLRFYKSRKPRPINKRASLTAEDLAEATSIILQLGWAS